MTTTALIPGTGAHALVTHLHALVDEAEHQLVRAPDHRELYRATLRDWCRQVEHDRKAEINRYAESGINVVAAFGAHIPPPSTLNLPAEEIRRRLAGLVAHQWLRPTPGSGTGPTALYRAQLGDVFGAPS